MQNLPVKGTRSHHPGLALGGVFLSLFGAAWLCGASYQFVGASVPLLSAIAAVGLSIAGWAIAVYRARRRVHSGTSDSAIRKGLMVVNVAQWSSLGATLLLLNLTGHVAWLLPSAILIVGAHFLPLAKILRYRGYYLTGAGLVLVAVLYLVSGGAGQSVALSLLATGAILWASAIALLAAM